MTFEQIVRMTQGELKNALVNELKKIGYSGVKASKQFLYAKGKSPVLLVAHMDTVHKTPVKTICKSTCGNIMMSPEGIGGDDRSGVYMILEIVRKLKCHVLFCEDEEVGALGARAFVKSGIKPKVNYIVEIDRRGDNDAVFYDCDNEEFTEFVTGFGFVESWGSFSDISVIAPALGIAAVNISAGYWNEHSLHEYIDMSVMKRNIELITKMASTESKKFIYVEGYSSWYYSTSHTVSRRSYGKKASKVYPASNYAYDDYFKYVIDESDSKASNGKVKVSLVPNTAYIKRKNGDFVDGSTHYLIDQHGTLYEWLYDYDVAVEAVDYSAYYDEFCQWKVFMSEHNSFMVVVATEDEAYELMYDSETISSDVLDCGYTACHGYHDKKYCENCFAEKDTVQLSTTTWSDISNEYSEDVTLWYMEQVWDESGEYPQWSDYVPMWALKQLETKKAAKAS